jgi:hypothetical protein
MAGPLTLVPLASTSPTMAEEMSICRLRAGLASRSASEAWVLHDPRLWLGTVLHSVLEIAGHARTATDLEAAWDAEIARFVRQAGDHQFDRRFADPTRWPSYFLVRQRALSSAAKLLSDLQQRADARLTHGHQPSTQRRTERRLVARAGRLIGRPDRFDRWSVTDFKSTLPDATSPIGAEILGRNQRQIKIYAAMIAEILGYWPNTGIITAASGASITFNLVPAECDAEADNATLELDGWNNALLTAEQPDDIANPSAAACQNCRFQLVCPAFWAWISAGMATSMPRTAPAASGILSSVQSGNDGDLQTLHFSHVSATLPTGTELILTVRRSIHGDFFPTAIGTECRITAAAVRADGRLRADYSTLVMSTNQIPVISIQNDAPGSTLRVADNI